MAFQTPPPTPPGSPRRPPTLALGDDPGAASSAGAAGDTVRGGGDARPSLRGSEPPKPKAAEASSSTTGTTTTTRTQLAKDSELKLGTLPVDPAGYSSWRYNLEVQLECTTSVDAEQAEQFVLDMNAMAIDDLEIDVLPPELRDLDRKLFKSLIECIKPREHEEHLKDVRARTKIKRGRHALRVLDEAYEYMRG